jgi:hypothetical protein
VRKLDALPQQALEKILAFGETQFDGGHTDGTAAVTAGFR